MTQTGTTSTGSRRRALTAVALAGVGVLAVGALAASMAQAGTEQPPTPPPSPTTTPPPVLTDFSFTPSTVDVRSEVAYVTVTVRANSVEPIRSVGVGFKGKGVSSAGATLELSSGTRTNGVWSGKARVNPWLSSGVWSVDYVQLSAAYPVTYGPEGGTASPSWNPAWPTKLRVTSTPDVTPPAASSFTVSTTSVDTTRTSKKVRVTIVATDSQSGLRGAYVQAKAPGSLTGRTDAKFVKSPTRPNTYTATLTIPKNAGAGTHMWSLQLSLADKALNLNDINTAGLAAENWQSTLKVTSRA